MTQHAIRKRMIPALLAAALATVISPSAALAQKGKDTAEYLPVTSYRVEANSTYWVNLNLCSNPVVVAARGMMVWTKATGRCAGHS